MATKAKADAAPKTAAKRATKPKAAPVVEAEPEPEVEPEPVYTSYGQEYWSKRQARIASGMSSEEVNALEREERGKRPYRRT
jgi:hypothetical protein